MHRITSLAILQQSEYDVRRWRKWLKAHHNETQVVEPAEWTPKLRLIDKLSRGFFFLPSTLAIQTALLLSRPLEFSLRQHAYRQAQSKLNQYRRQGLQVVAIAGSYGKTSTKHILEHTLGSTQHILITPKSINTMLGIAQVIDRNLNSGHTLFVVELGEYHRGDIAQLCAFIKPDFGILTPIGRQHLEMLGDFPTVVAELSDLVSYFKHQPEKVLIHEINRPHFSTPNLQFYGQSSTADWRVDQAKVTRAGTEFKLEGPQQPSISLFTPLFGEHQAVNTLPSFWLAAQLQTSLAEISKRISTQPYIHRRHEPTFAQNNVLILDNSYNTNADSVKASLELLNQLEATRRIVVTLGFTETGSMATQIHQEFGATLAQQTDYLGLIQAPWTLAIIEGFTHAGGDQNHITIGDTQENAFQQLQHYIIPGTVILFEGGYQEVYV